jgi:hypothetical protein
MPDGKPLPILVLNAPFLHFFVTFVRGEIEGGARLHSLIRVRLSLFVSDSAPSRRDVSVMIPRPDFPRQRAIQHKGQRSLLACGRMRMALARLTVREWNIQQYVICPTYKGVAMR